MIGKIPAVGLSLFCFILRSIQKSFTSLDDNLVFFKDKTIYLVVSCSIVALSIIAVGLCSDLGVCIQGYHLW